MGVWIETELGYASMEPSTVTPCMGVWIETKYYTMSAADYMSHTLYGCVD